jgi:aryl carrier-like protein
VGRIEEVAPDTELFEAGATSLQALTLVSRARLAGLPLTVQDIYAFPTVRGQAMRLEERMT